ncbi:MAG TPA: hypothetical protein VK762_14995 [Polyangiaceae bacterium]|jgi:hypothetical protein|nr:hypothetical protein [Polyangiaceae bacterium]
MLGITRRELLAAIGVAATAVVGRRWVLPALEGIMDKGETIVVSEADLALARRFPVIWDPSESGAPALFDLSERIFADVDTPTYRAAVRTAEVLLDEGELAPGHYEYEDPLGAEPDEFKPFVSHSLAQITGGRVAVDVTEAHLKLLKNANVRLRDDGGRGVSVGIDSKRPYGDMTYFYIDMGAILGIAPEGPPRTDRPGLRMFAEAQEKAFDALHEQMQPVVQAFVLYATLAPGRFARQPPGYGPMRRVS